MIQRHPSAKQLSAFYDGEIPAGHQHLWITKHLKSCFSCNQQLKEWGRLSKALSIRSMDAGGSGLYAPSTEVEIYPSKNRYLEWGQKIVASAALFMVILFVGWMLPPKISPPTTPIMLADATIPAETSVMWAMSWMLQSNPTPEFDFYLTFLSDSTEL